jgi:phage FluMu protein Com
MMEVEVILDLCCTICCHPMGVTLKCAGKGLLAGAKARAAVKVPCPTCASVNKIVFAPDGTIHHLTPDESPRIPEPSWN